MPAPDRYAVIGHPVAHSLSPRIHGLFAEQTHQHLSYGTVDVLPEQLESSVRTFFAGGGRGLNVTVPHKQAVVALLDRLGARAERAGAVNTIVRQDDGALFGDNTDGIGLVCDLTQNLHLSLRGRRVLLLGAGGAARGVVGPLLSLAPAEIAIANRTHQHALDLAAAWAASGRVRAVAAVELEARGLAGFDLIVNATPPQAAALAVPHTALRAVCYDMVYGKPESGFRRWARQGGAADIHDGLGMLVEQAAESFALWRGVRPNTSPVLAALRIEAVGAAAH
jgi:shikimate dehydrogenase